MRIVREGWPWVLLPALAGGAAALSGRRREAGLLGVLSGLSAWFFRDPPREPVWDRELLVSPADGKVALVRYLTEFEEFPGPVYRVGIFMRLHDVHVNRSPVSGRVRHIRWQKGGKLPALWEEAFSGNEKRYFLLERDDGVPVLVVQVAGALARRTVSFLRPGDEVLAGDRLGMIKLGSRVELFFPAEGTRLLVREGHRVRAGESPLALLPWRGR
ncbi:phosphatidylserine decarboxylase [Thermosulfurimonas marina]|uniref:Phosphatidylserine decarboxylase n=1 Tax=Thermosulfurimonas marina TaxID=2047767 RepID=A0A6H1WTV0_9BACT|nr:phosphatidylserine decarboxylase [Thermosulfurimonas marina]QJA06627.1 phosphatidylserine decarboxylase [Thermosulfurimonas marina]